MSKRRVVVSAVVIEHRPLCEVIADYGVSRSWLYELLARRATDSAAAVSDAYSGKCSSTWRTHRSLIFGSIFFGMARILATEKDAASNLGRFSRAKRMSFDMGASLFTALLSGCLLLR